MAMRRRRPVKDRVRRFVLPVFLERRREGRARTVKEPEVFDVAHLEQMMRSRRWDDAENYLRRFLLPLPCDQRSTASDLLFIDIGKIRMLAKIAAGGQEGSQAASLFRKLPPSPFASRIKMFIAQMKSDETRPNLLKIWHKVELEGVDMIMESVARCPELQGYVPMPPERSHLWVAAEHRLRYGLSRCKKKAAGRTPSHVLTCAFRRKRLSIQGRKKQKGNHPGVRSRASSSFMPLNMETEQAATEPILGEQPRENVETTVDKQDHAQF